MTTTVTILKGQIGHLGGAEKYALRLATAFVARGCQVTILTTGPLPDKPIPCAVVSLCPRHKVSFLHLRRFDRLCQQWLRDTPSDIVFGMDRNSHQTHYRAGNGVHAAYLQHRQATDSWFKALTFGVNPLHRTILQLERQCFEDPALRLLFTNSAMVRDELLTHYDVDTDKVRVVHNGVEWKEMQTQFDEGLKQQQQIRTALGLDPHAFQLLFVGQGYRRKGLSFLLHALARLRRADVHLAIVGKDRETKHFHHLTKQLDLERQVRFFGKRRDVYHFYQAADALAIPSVYDPFANVTVEALAMGLFVVSSKGNGGHEVLTETNGAVIEDLFDTDAVVTALQKAIARPKDHNNAVAIRNSTQHLDFSHQLNTLVEAAL